jgi:signal transduction histidine kinase
MEVSRQVRDSAGQLRVATSQMLEDLSTSLVQSSDRLAEGVNEHRILLAAERGDLRVQPVALNTAEVMRLLVGTFEALPIAAGRLMALAKPIHSAPFTSDQTLLKLVLGHMVRNALEACDPEQTVTLNAAVAQETVEFTVHNPGFMPRDVQLQVFQRGFTTKGEGRGLGTYTMRLLGERCLRGSVTFASTPNVGTTFKFNGPVSLAG